MRGVVAEPLATPAVAAHAERPPPRQVQGRGRMTFGGGLHPHYDSSTGRRGRSPGLGSQPGWWSWSDPGSSPRRRTCKHTKPEGRTDTWCGARLVCAAPARERLRPPDNRSDRASPNCVCFLISVPVIVRWLEVGLPSWVRSFELPLPSSSRSRELPLPTLWRSRELPLPTSSRWRKLPLPMSWRSGELPLPRRVRLVSRVRSARVRRCRGRG